MRPWPRALQRPAAAFRGPCCVARARRGSAHRACALRSDFAYMATDAALDLLRNATYDMLYSDRLVLQPSQRPRNRDPQRGGRRLCDYYLFTNGDNLYHANLFPAAMPLLRLRHDMVAFEYVSRWNYRWFDTQAARSGRDVQIFTAPTRGSIDLGAAFFSASLLNCAQYGRFVLDATDRSTPWKELDSDLGMRLAQQTRDIVIIRRVLFIHQ